MLFGGVMNRIQFALRLSLLVLMASVLGYAQTGSIQGSVTDKSGAVIQDADVVVTSLNTNQTRAAKSGDAGTYSVPSLAAGPYRDRDRNRIWLRSRPARRREQAPRPRVPRS